MAKKNFKSGLGDLFDDAFHNAKKGKVAATAPAEKTADSKKERSFAESLDNFLQEAIAEQIKEAKDAARKPAKRTKPSFGLDSLIRETVETAQIETTPQHTKRVTFVFEEEKINKLQQIARLKKAYIRDVIHEIIAEYIERYEAKV